jgi:hypothetical protein
MKSDVFHLAIFMKTLLLKVSFIVKKYISEFNVQLYAFLCLFLKWSLVSILHDMAVTVVPSSSKWILLYYYPLGDTSADGLSVLGGVIHPFVSVSALLWFILYIHYVIYY